MRVLQITENYPPNHKGGAELSCEKITLGLMRRGHEAIVLTNKLENSERLNKNNNYKIVYFKARSKWDRGNKELLYNDYEKLKKIVIDINPDIIHLHLFENELPCAALLANDFPLVYTVHNYTLFLTAKLKIKYLVSKYRTIEWGDLFVYLKHLFKYDKKYIQLFTDESLKKAKCLVCPSKFIQDLVLKNNKSLRTELIYNGIEDNYLQYKSINNPMEIIYSGRIEKYKGVEDVVMAARKLVRAGYNVNVSLIGDGSFKKTVKNMVKKMKLSQFVNFINHQREINYSQYDGVVIYPSRWEENCSLTIIEALSAGKIIITTARGGNSEIIQDLYNGLIVKTKDPNDIFLKIAALSKCKGLVDYLSYNARETFVKYFSIDCQLDKIEKIYKLAICQK